MEAALEASTGDSGITDDMPADVKYLICSPIERGKHVGPAGPGRLLLEARNLSTKWHTQRGPQKMASLMADKGVKLWLQVLAERAVVFYECPLCHKSI
jgi:hypothetical protein